MKQADKVNRIQFSLSLISLSDAVNILKHVMRLLLAECKSRGSRVHTSAFPQERTGFIANVDWRPTCPMTIKHTHVNTVFTKFCCRRQIGHVLAVKTGLCSRLLAVGNQNGGGCVEGVGTGTCCEVMQSQHGPPGAFMSEQANRGKINP